MGFTRENTHGHTQENGRADLLLALKTRPARSFKDRISSEIISLMRERRSSRPGAEAKPLTAKLDVPSSFSMIIRDTDESRQQKKKKKEHAFAKWVRRRHFCQMGTQETLLPCFRSMQM